MAEMSPEVIAVAIPPIIPRAVPPTAGPTGVAVMLVTGPQGPPGAAGGGSVSYLHTQLIPSTVWDIDHDLGYRPGGIHVVDADGNTYYPDVTHLDVNNVRLNLPESILGTAYLS